MKITGPGEYKLYNNGKAVVEFRTAADTKFEWIGYRVEGDAKVPARWRCSGLGPDLYTKDDDIVSKWNE